MGCSRTILLSFFVMACGGHVASSSQSGSSGGDAAGAPGASSGGASGAPVSSASPGANVTPVAAAAQSPVPEDGPCTVAPGPATLILPGHPEAFAVNGSFVYASDYLGVSRVPVTGGAVEAVSPSQDLKGAAESFVLGAGYIYFDGAQGTLTKVPVTGDPFIGPTYGARSSPYAAMAFDGVNVYSGQLSGVPDTIHRWPLNGAPAIATPVPDAAIVQAIVAAPDAAYVALLTVTNNGSTSTGSIAKVPLNGSGAVVIAKDVGEPTAIGVDDGHVYYAATRGGLATGGLYRMGFDGSGLTTLSEPSPMSFAVDAHSIYFLRSSLVYKVDKVQGGPGTKVGLAQPFGGVVVTGGNVYWSATGEGMSVKPGVWTACK